MGVIRGVGIREECLCRPLQGRNRAIMLEKGGAFGDRVAYGAEEGAKIATGLGG
jgi:hypothetical protein